MSVTEPAAPERKVRIYGSQKFDWNEKRVERLTKLWADGLSSSEIAAELGGGLSRNAVIGKVHRLNLPGRRLQARLDQHREKRLKKRTTIARWRRDGTSLKLMETTTGTAPELPGDHAPNPIGILELTTETCHWPAFGEGLNTTFCGDVTVRGFSYCLHHCQIAYRAPERRTPSGEVTRLNHKIRDARERAA